MAGYQYETSPRKLQPEYTPRRKRKSTVKTQKNNATKVKKQAKYNYKPLVYIVLGFAMLLTISYRYSLINEKYNEKEKVKSQVSSVEKQNEQLKVSIENSLNLSSVEQAAKEKLGMQKLDNSQKIYLNLQKKDYIESATEEVSIDENSSWFQKMMNKLTEIIK